MLYYNTEIIPLYPEGNNEPQTGRGIKETIVDSFMEGVTNKLKKINIEEDIIKPAISYVQPKTDPREDKKLDDAIEKQRRKMIKNMIGKGCCSKNQRKSSKIMNYL
jgi:hypothetical protein